MPSFEEIAQQRGVTVKPTGKSFDAIAQQKGVMKRENIPDPSVTGRNKIADFNIGGAKGALSTVVGGTGLVEKGFNSLLKTVLPKSIEEKTFLKDAPTLGIIKKPPTTARPTASKATQSAIERAKGLEEGQLTTPVNTAQKLGFGAEQLGEFLVPGSASFKVGKAANAAVKGGNVLKTVAGLGAGMGTEGVLATGQAAMQSGNLGAEEAKLGATSAAFFPIVPALGAVAKGAKSVVSPSLDDALKLYEKATDVRSTKALKFGTKRDKTLAKFLLDEQIPLDQMAGKEGTIVDTVKARQIIDERVPELVAREMDILKTRATQFDLNEILKTVKARIGATVKNAEEYEKMIQNAESMIGAEIRRNGSPIVSGMKAAEIKTGMWDRGYDLMNPTSNETARFIGNELKTKIQKAYSNVDDNIIKTISDKLGDYLSAKTALSDIPGGVHGKVIRGGMLGRMINQGIGAAIGSSGGFVGSAAGAKAGGVITDYLLNPSRLTQKALKTLQKNGEVPAYLKTLDEAKSWLRSEKLKQMTEAVSEQINPQTLRLGAPETPKLLKRPPMQAPMNTLAPGTDVIEMGGRSSRVQTPPVIQGNAPQRTMLEAPVDRIYQPAEGIMDSIRRVDQSFNPTSLKRPPMSFIDAEVIDTPVRQSKVKKAPKKK